MALPSSLALCRFTMAALSTSGAQRLPSSHPSSLGTPRRPLSSLLGDKGSGGGGRENLPPVANPKLFVSGLSFDTNESTLKDAFERYGEIIEVKVICDRTSGRSKGFGFILFSSQNGATTALQNMHGKLLDGRIIRVDHAGGRDAKTSRPGF